jgi:hypothetical protein
VAAGAATVVPSVLLGGHSSTLVTPAYAVTRGSDGTVSVTIYDIAKAVCRAPAGDLEPQKVQEAVVRTEVNGQLLGTGCPADPPQPASSATRSMRWTRPAWSGASGVTVRVVAPASRKASSRSRT